MTTDILLFFYYLQLSQFCSIRHISFGYGKYYRSIFAIKTGTEKFTFKWSNLLDWEIYYAHNLLPDEFVKGIMHCYLCTRLFHSNVSSKIHPNLIGRLASFWKCFCFDDGSDSELDGFKVSPGYFFLHRVMIKRKQKKSTPDRVNSLKLCDRE